MLNVCDSEIDDERFGDEVEQAFLTHSFVTFRTVEFGLFCESEFTVKKQLEYSRRQRRRQSPN